MSDPRTLLPPEQVQLILKRAAELDAKGESVTVAELRAIAQEAGLDPLATQSAIREVLASHIPQSPGDAGVTLRASAVNGAAGLGLGLAASVYQVGVPPAVSLLGLTGALVFALYRVLTRKDRKDRSTLLFENFITWAAFFIGAAILSGSGFPEVGLTGGFLWLLTSLIAVSAPRRLRQAESQGAAIEIPADSPAPQIGTGQTFSDGV